MSRSTISTFQLFALFPDEETARTYLEARIWPNGARCPDCGGERITPRPARPGFYHCAACNFDFTVRTNTIFERSKVPLNKWLYAMYLLVTARKGISSLQLAKEIGVTQKTAWFILGRLREACSDPDNIDKLRGIEIDGMLCRCSVKPPRELDTFADVILRYRPKDQQKKSAKRQRRVAKKAAKKTKSQTDEN